MIDALPRLLPDIPRWYTGLAEWAAAVVYISIVPPRFNGWRRWALIGAALPTMIGLQVLAGTWSMTLWVLGMATAIAAIWGFIFVNTDTNSQESIYLAARAFVLAELMASLEWQLWVHWQPQTPSSSLGSRLYSTSLFLLFVSYSIGFLIAWYAERKNFPRQRALAVDAWALITTLSIAIATFLVSNLSFLTTATPFSAQVETDIFYIRTLVDLSGFVALYTQQSNHNLIHDAFELGQARLLMKAQHQQYLQSKRNIEELNRMHHDLKHYAAAIRAEESAEMRSEYLQALEDSIRGYESEIATGNYLLDIALTSKMERCLQDGISMTTVVDGTAVDFMDAMRLSTLFGNAIDNAIEATLKVKDPEHRLIKVSVFTQGNFVMIRVENYFPFPIEFLGGLPQTTKTDRARHGVGTASMRRIVEHYGGSLTFTTENDWFIVRALIPRNND